MLLGPGWRCGRSDRPPARSTNWRNSCLTPPSVSPRAGIPEVPVSELGENDVVLVRPGTSVPADGEVVEGSRPSTVDDHGRVRPVDKAWRWRVVAGTVNKRKSPHQNHEDGRGTTLAGIMRLVDEAQKSRNLRQLLADRGWLAVLRGTRRRGDYGRRVGRRHGFNFIGVLERVVTVLVIACPHAPRTRSSARGRDQHLDGCPNRMLIRDRIAMEEAGTSIR